MVRLSFFLRSFTV